MFMRQYIMPVFQWLLQPMNYLVFDVPSTWPTWLAVIWLCMVVVGLVCLMIMACIFWEHQP